MESFIGYTIFFYIIIFFLWLLNKNITYIIYPETNIQELIDKLAKNLNGKTLTFQFLEGVYNYVKK